MIKLFRRVWQYLTAGRTRSSTRRPIPKVQLEQAIIEAQDQHRRLKEQAANVIANQKQTELRLNRAHGGAREGQRNARQAVLMADEATKKGDDRQGRPSTRRAAESFANRLIAARDARSRTSRRCTCRPPRPSDQAKAAVAAELQRLQKKLAERQKLLGQLDQAKMQEQMNKAMASLSETVGEDVPTFDEVRDKIEARYAKAKGMAELSGETVESRMLEVEQAARTPRPRPASPRSAPSSASPPPRPTPPPHARRRGCAGRGAQPPPPSQPQAWRARSPSGPAQRRRWRGRRRSSAPVRAGSAEPGPAEQVEFRTAPRRGRRGGRPRGGALGEVGGAPAGDGGERSAAPMRTRPLANTSPSGPATSTASSASKRPSTLDHAGRQQRAAVALERPAGAVVDHDRAGRADGEARSTACGPAAARSRGSTTVPTPGVAGDGVGAARRRGAAAAITARTPDQAAILAAATFDAMPPLPRAEPGAAGQGLELVVDLDDLLDERRRRVEPGVGGEQPGGVGEQHQQVGVDAGGRPGRPGGRCRRSGSRRRRWRRSR